MNPRGRMNTNEPIQDAGYQKHTKQTRQRRGRTVNTQHSGFCKRIYNHRQASTPRARCTKRDLRRKHPSNGVSIEQAKTASLTSSTDQPQDHQRLIGERGVAAEDGAGTRRYPSGRRTGTAGGRKPSEKYSALAASSRPLRPGNHRSVWEAQLQFTSSFTTSASSSSPSMLSERAQRRETSSSSA